MSQIVIATTTMYKSVEDHRAQVALRTIQQTVQHGHKIVVVDSSPQKVKNMFSDAGAFVFQDNGKTYGQSIRQAIRLAIENAPPGTQFIARIEPEKDTIVRYLKHMTRHAITIPRRASLSSYPVLQQHAENFGNEAFRIRTTRSLDMWFGPRVFYYTAAKFFLEYNGEYGDRWDSIFIPVIRAIAAGEDIGEEVVNFAYPPEQLAAENDSFEMVKKRLDQLSNLIQAIGLECAALGI